MIPDVHHFHLEEEIDGINEKLQWCSVVWYSVDVDGLVGIELWDDIGAMLVWTVWYGMVWYGMVWYGMVWYGMVWYGMVWYGMV